MVKEMKYVSNPYGELANAICLKAVEDYRNARCFFETGQKDRKITHTSKVQLSWLHRTNLASAIKFMNSSMFEFYCGLDGPSILRRLEEECDNGNYGVINRGGGYGKR